MADRATKFVSAFFAGAMLGLPMPTFAQNAQGTFDTTATASECLITPNRDQPRGQRWSYRVEPATGRRCWYLKDRADAASQPALPRAASQSRSTPMAPPTVATTPARPASRAAQSAMPTNARAELPGRNRSDGVTVKTPIFVTTGTAGASRGTLLESETSDAMLAAPPAPQPTDAAADATTGMPSGSGNPSDGPVPPVVPDAPSKPSASIQILFVVILGALAVAGVMGSVIHRMARSWRRRHARLRRHSIWRTSDGSRNGDWVARGGRDRRAANDGSDDQEGQVRRLLAQIAKKPGGKTESRAPLKSRAGAATRARTPSSRRAARASAFRP